MIQHQQEYRARVQAAADAWSRNQENKRNQREANWNRRHWKSELQEDRATYADERSGVILVFDEQKIVAAWINVFVREIIRGEQENMGSALVTRTPAGIPVLCQRPGRVMFTSGARLRNFEEQMNRRCVQVPRSYLESLSQSEYNRPWLRLRQEEKLVTLDHVVGLYQIGANRNDRNT